MGWPKKRESGEEPLTIYQALFEVELILAERFRDMTPIRVRAERSGEVFKFLKRYGEHIKRDREKNGEIIEKNGKRILRRKAGDDWF